ncbi:MAG: sugar phosphate isomerase/epimerase [Firmicutes bacterium]|nr:sugar phosphate isomerase/epimerase [Bacillota bacterium]
MKGRIHDLTQLKKGKFKIGIGMIGIWLRHDATGTLLMELKREGVDFLEFWLDEEGWARREPRIIIAIETGLDITFHCNYAGNYDISNFQVSEENETFQNYQKILPNAGKVAELKGSPALINIHCASAETGTGRQELFQRTVNFFRWAYDFIEKRKLKVNLVAELLPHDPVKVKIGDGIPELVKLRKAVGREKMGFCWDMGHYRANQKIGYQSKLTPGFLENVRHIHLHDMRMGVDHSPLNYGEVPYDKYISKLQGKNITMAMELDFNNTSLCGEPFSLLFSSLQKMKILAGKKP